jgi:hypothetical protein
MLGDLGGMEVGGVVAFFLAKWFEVDPNWGQGNLDRGLLVIALVFIGAVVGGLGCAGALHGRGHPGAVRTAIILVFLQVAAIPVPASSFGFSVAVSVSCTYRSFGKEFGSLGRRQGRGNKRERVEGVLAG